MIMKVTLGMNLIGVKSLEEARPFYENVLGMKFLEFRPPFSEAILDEKYLFNIEESDAERSTDWTERNVGTFKCCVFETDNIHAFLKKVEKFGGDILSQPEKAPWGWWEAKFSDPSNNIFIIEQEDK